VEHAVYIFQGINIPTVYLQFKTILY